MKRSLLLIPALLLACRGPDAADARMQPVVDAYAPGIRLGEPVDAAAMRRYRLAPAPYVGFADTAYRGPDGVERLYVHVDAYVDDGRPRVPPGARVTRVSLDVPEPDRIAAVDAAARRLLGTPVESCYRNVVDSTPHRARWWAASRERGVLLVSGVAAMGDTALFIVGASPLDSAHVRPFPCDEAVPRRASAPEQR